MLTPHAPLDEVAAALDTLVVLLQGRGAALADEIASVPALMRPSARNLAHYLALRSVDGSARIVDEDVHLEIAGFRGGSNPARGRAHDGTVLYFVEHGGRRGLWRARLGE